MDSSEILDAHVHLYGPEAAADPEGWGLYRQEPHWVDTVAPSDRVSIQGWSTPELLIRHMNEAGIAACVLLGWYWERQETCDLQNAWYLEWSAQHPGRFIPFATVQPAAGPRALDSLRRALDQGMKGIGELLPVAQGYGLEDPVFLKVMKLADERRLPVTLHATDPEKGPRAGPPTPLGPLLDLALRFPNASIILAHFGGGLAFRGMQDGRPLPPNLYFDTAASPLLYAPDVYPQSVERSGEDRILYGSDYPLLVYPRRTREPGLRPMVEEILGSGLGPTSCTSVLGGNLRRILARGIATG